MKSQTTWEVDTFSDFTRTFGSENILKVDSTTSMEDWKDPENSLSKVGPQKKDSTDITYFFPWSFGIILAIHPLW